MTQYIGEKEIKNINEATVEFTDGSSKEYSLRQQEYLVKEEATDPTTYRELVLEAIVPEMQKIIKQGDFKDVTGIVVDLCKILEEHDIRKSDLIPIISKILETYQEIVKTLVDSYNETFNIAVGKAFGTYEEGRPSGYFPEDIRVSDIRRLKDF